MRKDMRIRSFGAHVVVKMFCVSCGFQVEENATFCSICGQGKEKQKIIMEFKSVRCVFAARSLLFYIAIQDVR